MQLDISSQNNDTPSKKVTHFWVSCHPFVESSLFISPLFPKGPDEIEQVSSTSTLKLYDPDGAFINEISVTFPVNQVGVVELEHVLGACKLESGLKHAHLLVESSIQTEHYCRLHSREGGTMISSPAIVSNNKGTFFPLVFGKERANFICMVNTLDTEASMRCRLYFKKRTPDVVWHVPALGARVFSVEQEFDEFIELEGDEIVQGYVRIGTRSTSVVGVQLVERVEGTKDNGIFLSVS